MRLTDDCCGRFDILGISAPFRDNFIVFKFRHFYAGIRLWEWWYIANYIAKMAYSLNVCRQRDILFHASVDYKFLFASMK